MSGFKSDGKSNNSVVGAKLPEAIGEEDDEERIEVDKKEVSKDGESVGGVLFAPPIAQLYRPLRAGCPSTAPSVSCEQSRISPVRSVT